MEKLVLNRINNAMSWQESLKGGKLRWFYSFGTLQEFVADRTFSLDFDIDLSVVFGECNHEKLIASFEGSGYKVDSVLLSDKTKTPLNMHFKPTDSELKGTPTIDVYFWVKKGNIWYHTYDVKREGRKIPSKYIFKGVEELPYAKMWMFAPPKEVEAIIKDNPEGREIITPTGVWSMDIFGNHSGNKFYLPYMYGHCLTTWYGHFINRKFKKGQASRSPFIKEVKSCKDL